MDSRVRGNDGNGGVTNDIKKTMTKDKPTISTKTGDNGTTSLGDGTRVGKDHIRIEAAGMIDELNSHLGLLRAQDNLPNEIDEILKRIQQELMEISAEIGNPTLIKTTDKLVEMLDQELSRLSAQLPLLKEFIIPGGNKAAAQCHVSRTVCRRAECCIVKLSHQEKINPITIKYLNRLSDLLFMMAMAMTLSELTN